VTPALPRAKLADFGVAKVLESEASVAGTGTFIGTPHYLAPEIFRGELYDERADAWALGCVLYEMMCLHRPFHTSEANVAVLAVHILEGHYDKKALEQHSVRYSGVLLEVLLGLLTPELGRRQRAQEVLAPLRALQAELESRDVAAADADFDLQTLFPGAWRPQSTEPERSSSPFGADSGSRASGGGFPGSAAAGLGRDPSDEDTWCGARLFEEQDMQTRWPDAMAAVLAAGDAGQLTVKEGACSASFPRRSEPI